MKKRKRKRIKRRIEAADNVPSTLKLTAPLDIAAAGTGQDGQPKARTFHIVAYNGGEMRVGLDWPVVVDLAGLQFSPKSTPVMLDHERHIDAIFGQTDDIRVEGSQLIASGRVLGTGDEVQRVVGLADAGFVWQASVGVEIRSRQNVRAGGTVNVNGRAIQGPAMIVRSGRLKEISVVSIGADANTNTMVAGDSVTQKELNDMDPKLKAWIEAKGHDVDQLDAEKIAELKAAYEAEQANGNGNGDVNANVNANGNGDGNGDGNVQASDISKQRRQQADELRRQARIREVCGDKHTDIAAKAIEEGWSVEKAELEAMKASRPNPPRARDGGERPNLATTLQAAACMTIGIGDEKHLIASYGEDAVNEADQFRGMGLRQLADICARANNVDLPINVGGRDWMQAAFSNTDLPNILGNVANKALAQAFTAGTAVVPRIARRVSHSNFHAHTVASMGLDGSLQSVAPDGELQHLSVSEETRTRQVDTKGAILRVTRKDVINDELGAMVDNAMSLGRKALASRESTVFALFNGTGAGSSFFTSARGNYISGSSTALSHEALSTAIAAFLNQTDPSGDPVNVMPRMLLVPPALLGTAQELFRSTMIMAAGGSSKDRQPTTNIHAGSYEPVVSPYLTSGSTTAWYLIADPNDLAVVDVAYLNGNDVPTIETFGFDSNPDNLGFAWRVYYDFGAALAEYRAGVKSKGAA